MIQLLKRGGSWRSKTFVADDHSARNRRLLLAKVPGTSNVVRNDFQHFLISLLANIETTHIILPTTTLSLLWGRVMAYSFVADCQYNDLKGTTAFDGYDGPPLDELAKRSEMPSDYVPVGFELFRLDPAENGKIPFHVVAVRRDEVGATADAIVGFARENRKLPIHRFEAEICPEEFRSVFKRIRINAIEPDLHGYKIVSGSDES